jgi:hypothetical protein
MAARQRLKQPAPVVTRAAAPLVRDAASCAAALLVDIMLYVP